MSAGASCYSRNNKVPRWVDFLCNRRAPRDAESMVIRPQGNQ